MAGVSRLVAAILLIFSLGFGTAEVGRAPVRDDADTELLARLVAAEAGDEPYMAQVSFAATVVNRTRTCGFPDTIREVILDDGAYPSVGSGELTSYHASKRQMRVARRAAQAALRGVDPTGGALFCADSDDYVRRGVVLMYECGGLVFGK